MKLSKRETALIIILSVLICAAGYYLFYLAPKIAEINEIKARIGETRAQIDAAAVSVIKWGGLSLQKENLNQDFSAVLDLLPENFNEADILRLAQKIIAPRAQDIEIKFSGAERAEITAVHTADISFAASYAGLKYIFKAFADEAPPNRIINFSCINISSGGDPLLQVKITAEFITR